MSTTVYIITFAAFLVGALNQAVQTGKLLNTFTVPAVWLPRIALLGGFLATAAEDLREAGSITKATLLHAFMVGLVGLVGGGAPMLFTLHGSQSRNTLAGRKMAAVTAVDDTPATPKN